MNDAKFVKSELKVTASEELEKEVQEELESSEQSEEKSIASVLEDQGKCCGGNKCSGKEA
jgi:hypothetical protein|tara:strand:- start:2367 stop:2546 length:180 start_codon:yes stop_codon:yes gene_type:complete